MTAMALILTLLLCILNLASLSLQDTKDPVRDFCRRWGHQTAVIDRKLYIDGGQIDWNPISQNPLNYTNTWLLYNDLNTQVPGSDLGMPQLYANLSKNSTIPSVSGGILWADEVNKIFYLYGGEFSDAPTDYSLFGYDTILNQWNVSANTPRSILRTAWGSGVAINDRAEGYYLGGWLSNKSVPGWSGPPIVTSTLIKYRMDTNEWTNNTGPDTTGRAEGAMVYLPASDGGLLIYFGGILWYPNGTVSGSDMNSIYIFDLASQKWYTQTATGDVPENRRKFCAGVTWAKDRSSYNIYLYGGQGITNVTGFDDVYILTLPSFQWIKWYPREPGEGNPHGLLSCNVIANSQMLIIGGWFNQHQDCDSPNVWGTHNLNLGENGPNKALWDLYWPNITEYFVPPEVIQKIGGGPSGGATLLKPQTSWNNRDLPVYFSRTPSFSARTATRFVPTSFPTNTTTPASGDSNNTAAIAGGAAGGGVALLLVLGLVWWCLRRRKNQKMNKKPGQSEEKPVSLPPSELPAIPPQELSSHYNHDSLKRGSPLTQSDAPLYTQSPSQPGSPVNSPQLHSPGIMTPAPSYPSPSTPYGSGYQPHYLGHSPPPSTNSTGLFTENGYSPANFSPTFNNPISPEASQLSSQNSTYDPSQNAYQQQHYSPVESNPTYPEGTYPLTSTSTPTQFYPQPLNIPRRESEGRPPYSPGRGRFVEQEFH